MTASKAVIIDGVLKELGDRLFYDPVRPMKARINIKGTKVSAKPKLQAVSRTAANSSARSKLKKTVKKVPEVMVKVSGGGKSVSHIKAHLDYVSRNGDVPLEDENGDLIQGRESLRDLKDEWQYGRMPLSRESNIKQSFNIVLSMPPGTDRAAVTNAAREFAKAEFASNYNYVFGTHEDEKHPHVHLCVKAMGRDGVRLNPRKADLQRWRELFAEKLHDYGIEANATKRQVRGITLKARKQPVVHMEKRGVKSRNRLGQTKAVADQIKSGNALMNPYENKIKQTRAVVESAFLAAASALERSGSSEDRLLAKEVKEHVSALPAPKTARQLAVEGFNKELEKGRGRQGPGKNK